MEVIAFSALAFVAIISSLGVVLMKNPVHSALWMLATFFSVAGVFVQLDAEYVAAIQILVYAGAILILYLFVVMLLNPDFKGFMKFPMSRVLLGVWRTVTWRSRRSNENQPLQMPRLRVNKRSLEGFENLLLRQIIPRGLLQEPGANGKD